MVSTATSNFTFLLQEGMFNNANVIFRTKFVDGVSTVARTIGIGSSSKARALAEAHENEEEQPSNNSTSTSRKRVARNNNRTRGKENSVV
jgi:structural maintenance of chromosome 2